MRKRLRHLEWWVSYRLARWEVQTGHGDTDHVRWTSKAAAIAYSEGVQDALEHGVGEHLVRSRWPSVVPLRHGAYRFWRSWYYGGKP